MAASIIIGAAFGKIVSSYVGDVIMPPIGKLIGGINSSNLAFTVRAAAGDVLAVVVSYGKFIQIHGMPKKRHRNIPTMD